MNPRRQIGGPVQGLCANLVLRFLITVTHLGSMPRRGILSIAVGFNLRKREACTSTWTLKGSTIWEGCVLSQHNGPSGAPLAQMGSGLVDPFRVVPNYWAGDRAHGLKPVVIQSAPLQGECRISLRAETITNQRWPVHGHCTIRDSIYEIVCLAPIRWKKPHEKDLSQFGMHSRHPGESRGPDFLSTELDSGVRRNGAPVSAYCQGGASPLQVYATTCNRL